MPSDALMVTWDVRSIKGLPKAESLLAGAEKTNKQNIKTHHSAISTTVALKGQLFLHVTQKRSYNRNPCFIHGLAALGKNVCQYTKIFTGLTNTT